MVEWISCHPEAHEQRVKGVSRTRLLRVRKAEGSPLKSDRILRTSVLRMT